MDAVAPTGLPHVLNSVMFGHTKQPVATSHSQHLEPTLVGRSKTAQSSPVKPRPAVISSSTSASNLLGQPLKQPTPAGSEVANGKLLARLQTAPPQSMVRPLPSMRTVHSRQSRPLQVQDLGMGMRKTCYLVIHGATC